MRSTIATRLLLEALVVCAGVTLRAVATSLGIVYQTLASAPALATAVDRVSSEA
jgi:hypothetical protein